MIMDLEEIQWMLRNNVPVQMVKDIIQCRVLTAFGGLFLDLKVCYVVHRNKNMPAWAAPGAARTLFKRHCPLSVVFHEPCKNGHGRETDRLRQFDHAGFVRSGGQVWLGAMAATRRAELPIELGKDFRNFWSEHAKAVDADPSKAIDWSKPHVMWMRNTQALHDYIYSSTSACSEPCRSSSSDAKSLGSSAPTTKKRRSPAGPSKGRGSSAASSKTRGLSAEILRSSDSDGYILIEPLMGCFYPSWLTSKNKNRPTYGYFTPSLKAAFEATPISLVTMWDRLWGDDLRDELVLELRAFVFDDDATVVLERVIIAREIVRDMWTSMFVSLSGWLIRAAHQGVHFCFR
jgi:hypothetical protein